METYSGTIPNDGLLYFTATWCGPCRAMKPELKKLGDVGLVSVDVDQFPEVATKFGVRSVPSYVQIIGGELARRDSGVSTARELRAWMARPFVPTKRLPPLTSAVLGTTRRPTLALRLRMAEALLLGTDFTDVDPWSRSLREVEGATPSSIMSFAKHLEADGHAKLVYHPAEVDWFEGPVAARWEIRLKAAGKRYVKGEIRRAMELTQPDGVQSRGATTPRRGAAKHQAATPHTPETH